MFVEPRTRNPYPAKFRGQLVALAPAGRCVGSLAHEYQRCAAPIHSWVKQIEVDDGDCYDGLSSKDAASFDVCDRSAIFV